MARIHRRRVAHASEIPFVTVRAVQDFDVFDGHVLRDNGVERSSEQTVRIDELLAARAERPRRCLAAAALKF